MRLFSRSVLLMGLFFAATSMMTIQKSTRVIFFGDSITEAGAKPGGYITKIGDALKQRGQDSGYDLIGAGIGGNYREVSQWQ